MQRTFGATVGMEPIVKPAELSTDIIECSDGTKCKRSEAYTDCRGNYHANEDIRNDVDVKIVEKILDGIFEGIEAYTSKNTDYPNGYTNVVEECKDDWDIEDWIRDEYNGQFDHVMSQLVMEVCDNITVGSDCEPEFESNEYLRYRGDGCCLYSFDIGEYEEHIQVSYFDELQALHDDGRLDDILDDVDSYLYVHRRKKTVLNEERYEEVGRKTYDHYDKDPQLMGYAEPGGKWHYVVSHERMLELVGDSVAELARRDG